jgi:peptidoglycan-N-acetylglucosamine deacetylase
VKTWKSVAGFALSTAALSTCGAVMVSGMPLPGDAAWADTQTPVASTTDTPRPAGRPSIEDETVEVVGNTGNTAGKHIALTFDDGPDPTWTPQVLDLLERYGVTATFCIVGTNAQAHPELVRRIADAGHALCDHTMHHDENLPSLPVDDRKAEIVDGLDAIHAAAPDAEVPYFRAPAGAFSRPDDPDPDSVQRIAARLGMTSLGWAIDTEDWTKPGDDAIVSAVQQAGGGDVVLLHDGGGDRQQTVTAVERLLPWLVDQGYRFDLP